MPPITLLEARDALIRAGITGPHQSHSRRNNLSKIKALLEGDPDGAFGLTGFDDLDAKAVLECLAGITGCSADITDDSGFDTIDPDKTVAGIVAAARRLRDAARAGLRLLTVTGHPTGLLEHHMRVVDAYRSAGGEVLHLREGENLSEKAGKHLEVRYNGGVGCEADWGTLRHTHSARAMEALLKGEPWPDLVLGDHGFAGAAIERSIPTIAVMDINDPALAVACATGRDVTIVPMDDNRTPRLYRPSWMLFEAIIAGHDL
ncbi:MAG TPA: phosphatase [Actinomycetota bacterium]|nr:phosphatase [Actinomycetota bacterium]